MLLEEFYSILRVKPEKFYINAGPLYSRLQLLFVLFLTQQHAVLSVWSLPFTVQNIPALGMGQGCVAKGAGDFDPF